MTILHLPSQLEVTNTETHVESLVGELTKRGPALCTRSRGITTGIEG